MWAWVPALTKKLFASVSFWEGEKSVSSMEWYCVYQPYSRAVPMARSNWPMQNKVHGSMFFFLSLSFVCVISFILFCFVLAFFVLLAFVCFFFKKKKRREGDTFTEQGGRGLMYIEVWEDLSRDGKEKKLDQNIFYENNTKTWSRQSTCTGQR